MASSDCEPAARPLIGITSYIERASYTVWETDSALLPRSYVDAVLHAGGIPVLVPPTGDGSREVAARMDGLLFSGGADVDPAHYGEAPHERTHSTRPERDRFEFELLAAGRRAGLPILAVCRGAQLLNVACGGTLTQHLPDRLGHCEHQPGPGVFGTNRIAMTAGSRVGSIVGDELAVHCHHHQAIARLGEGLTATAWAADGAVEAVEADDDEFVLGVQWHPEENRADGRLFGALVERAGRYRKAHE